jgi:hypothetical protein
VTDKEAFDEAMTIAEAHAFLVLETIPIADHSAKKALDGNQVWLARQIVKAMQEVERRNLIARLPLEMWTESDEGQALLHLAKEGRVRYTRLNSTFGRFDRVDSPS